MVVLRVGTLLAFVYAGAMIFLGYQARAQMSEVFLGVGEEMMRYADADRHSEVRQLNVNGQTLYVMSGSADRELSEVLDWYEARCHERDGQFAQQFQDLVDQGRLGSLEEAKEGDPTLREESDDAGFVACMDIGSNERLETEGVAGRIARFQETLDLAEFGTFRYIYAIRGERKTVFLNMWTSGSFQIDEMFPEQGDAPGVDPEGVPRPPGSERIFSAHETGIAHSVTLYARSSDNADELERFYRTEMPERGFTLLELTDDELERAKRELDLPDEVAEQLSRRVPHHLVFEQDDRLVSVHLRDHRTAGGTATVLTSD